ncbi:aminoglycoside phosphotransferase family protein [Microtetraspora sp. NBRC 16547]|uniref:aminoglycoside phosphotransferase family protein n=1 Tax=Microtetraspora sp. NBRC 16547 TaxID=3030993 RepID=UPI0024A49DB3|nr:aminoglycoside phosphotransferase family protein [Microtetraspora sp. NBRC 16547]GLX01447.1 aminoglycoside phosphotransferase [Microtetraspora sp. NBRC 16547]
MHKSEITQVLIRQLLEEQFPQWASLPIRPVERDGWDNLTMRLGDTMSLRFPSAEMYASQVEKEHRWLPVLRDHLPVTIPNPLGKGVPGCGFPRPWSVYEWLPGHHATVDRVSDLAELARDLSRFLTALYQIDATGGPEAGLHSFYRGASPVHWDESARTAITALADVIDAPLAMTVWRTALSSSRDGSPVWFHGDMSAGNLLVRDGKLSAVIDFGTCGVGDPACDLVIAWSFFHGESREEFRRGLALGDDTWARARGWMLWKAAITLRDAREETPDQVDNAGMQFGWRVGAIQVIEDILAEHRQYTAG